MLHGGEMLNINPIALIGPRLKLHPAQIFRLFVFGVVLGFIVSEFVKINLYVLLAAILVLVLIFYFNLLSPRIILLLLGILLTLIRVGGGVNPPALSLFTGPQYFAATVVEPPRASEKVVRYIVESKLNPIGRILLIAKPYPPFSYGEKLKVSCKNVVVVDFSVYISKGIYRECAFPEIESVAGADFSIKKLLLDLREAAGYRLKQVLAEPYASLATGMLWGDDAGLPKEITNSFRRTGTTHLLAVSGYNVMVLTEILFWFLIAIGLWRKMASFVVLGLIVLFVIFTGGEPAVVRAGIMGSLLVIARLMSRKPDNINVLLGAAAVMLFIAPTLISDLGFQLSFAAMAGLMFVAPFLSEQLKIVPNIWGLRLSVAQTLAATIITLPFILIRLDQLSLVSPIANVLIGPVIFLVFILGLPLLPLSFWGGAATVVAWLLSLVLAYVIMVVGGLGSLPWASAQNSLWLWFILVVLYGIGVRWCLKNKFKIL
jgi:ComEC/Rec2-related protein